MIEAAPQLGEFARAMELASKKNVDAFGVMAKVLNETTEKADQLQLDIKRRAAPRCGSVPSDRLDLNGGAATPSGAGKRGPRS